jgi:hypothetical protein
MKNYKQWIILPIYYFVIFVAALGLIEVLTETLLNNPRMLPHPTFTKVFRTYYKLYDRAIIQLLPVSAQYDEQLSYTLKPGSWQFKNREFETNYYVNRMGLRDDEYSLTSPEVIILGDSHAMGWGVEQYQTFAQIIENLTDLTVLNAAVSSYGTVRALKLLERIDLSTLKFLVIQYSSNDFTENNIYYQNDNFLPIMSNSAYEQLKTEHQRIYSYFFGKHTIFLTRVATKGLMRRIQKPNIQSDYTSDLKEAGLFLNILNNSKLDFSAIKIIVIEINEYAQNDNKFITAIKKSLTRQSYQNLYKQITTVNLSTLLSEDLYFTLDGHLIPAGHKIIADAVVAKMEF